MYESDIEHLRKIVAALRALPADHMLSAAELSNVIESLCAVLTALCGDKESSGK